MRKLEPEREQGMNKLTAPGWTIPDIAILHNGYIEWYDIEERIFRQVDPETGKSRHKGPDPDCAWTEWENKLCTKEIITRSSMPSSRKR